MTRSNRPVDRWLADRLARHILLVALVAAGLLTVGNGLVSSRADADAADLLAGSSTAASNWEFDGTLELRWSDAGTTRTATAVVTSRAGVVELGASSTGRVLSDSVERLVADPGVGWRVLWDTDDAVLPRPDPDVKYDITSRPGPSILGRPATLVTVTHPAGWTIQQVAVDDATGIVLRREQFDASGATVRSVAFTSVTVLGPMSSTRTQTATRLSAPTIMSSLRKPYRAPTTAGDGFRLAGRYRHNDGSVQVFYSDGLTSVSVFESTGELDWNALPAGSHKVTVNGQPARAWTTAAADVLVWERDGVVYTCVSDADRADRDRVVAALGAKNDRAMMAKVADTLLGPFRWH